LVLRTTYNVVKNCRKGHSSQEEGSHVGAKERPPRKWDAWAQALRAIVLHPEQHASIVLQVTDEAVVISDQYPKVLWSS
jgi:hypothetical protein